MTRSVQERSSMKHTLCNLTKPLAVDMPTSWNYASGIAKMLLLIFSMLVTCTVYAQENLQISGVVTLSDGTPGAGVTVAVKGTTTGTITDVNGNFKIAAPATSTLVFSQVGLARQEVAVSNRTQINVSMADDVSELNEVVVVGYGTQKKVNLTGAVSVIDGEQLSSRPVPNVTGALQGVSPGLTVLRGSGKPGAEGYGIRVRGFSSALNDAKALVLVDGIEMDINLLNPDDVQSISVL